MAKTYSVFISHSWDYANDLMGLRRLLIERGYFNVQFEEVPSHEPINSYNDNYIKSVIRRKLVESDVVIGMAGFYGSFSGWMKWELETAKAMGKPILAVIPWGQTRTSQVVENLADKTVHWNTESIVAAIRELA